MKELKDSEIKTSPPKKPLTFQYPAVLIVLMLLNVFPFLSLLERQVVEMPYSQFLTTVDGDQVEQMALDETSREIVFIARDDGGREGYHKTGVWPDDDQRPLAQLQAKEGITFTAEIPTQANSTPSLLVSWILPIVIFIVIGELLSRRMMKRMGGLPGGMDNAITFDKSGVEVYVEEVSTGVSFAGVAGQDKAKESLMEVVDFLHGSEKYAAIGAHLPKGVLLVGSLDTDKTLLAKAVAGEVKVPSFSISGSEFVGMFVGMGAAKVRGLFKQAGEKAPCIVFIDEIGAIGKKRDIGGLGGNDEREQILDQLLVEVDGFDFSRGVVLLAATNRSELLDPALLYPGRSGRRVPVELSDLQGRIAILKAHGKRVHINGDANWNAIARATVGASGAEPANIVNEGAPRVVRLGWRIVTRADLEESVEIVTAGAQRKNVVTPPQEKQIVSYYEADHALVATLQSHSAPVTKITIIPRTSGALGYTMRVDEGEKMLMSRTELENKLAIFIGGWAAEELIFGPDNMTTGASNDIEQTTKLARVMTTHYSMMEELGTVALETVQNQYLGGDTALFCSAETAAAVDRQVVELIHTAHQRTLGLLRENESKLRELAGYLPEKETITGKEFMEWFQT